MFPEQQEAVCETCGHGGSVHAPWALLNGMEPRCWECEGKTSMHPLSPSPVVPSDDDDCEFCGEDDQGRLVMCERHAREYDAELRDLLTPAPPTPAENEIAHEGDVPETVQKVALGLRGALPPTPSQDAEGDGRECRECHAPATWYLGDVPFCWQHDERGGVEPVRAAWRRYNSACNAIQDALDEGEQPTAAEIRERDEAKAGVESAIRASYEASYEALVKAAASYREVRRKNPSWVSFDELHAIDAIDRALESLGGHK